MDSIDLNAHLLTTLLLSLSLSLSLSFGSCAKVVVMDRKMVRQHYLRTHFVWDLIAAAPIVFFPMTVISKVSQHVTSLAERMPTL